MAKKKKKSTKKQMDEIVGVAVSVAPVVKEREKYGFGGVASKLAKAMRKKVVDALFDEDNARKAGMDTLDDLSETIDSLIKDKNIKPVEYQAVRDELINDIKNKTIGDWSDAVGDTRFMNDSGAFDSELVDTFLEKELYDIYPQFKELDKKFTPLPVMGGILETDRLINFAEGKNKVPFADRHYKVPFAEGGDVDAQMAMMMPTEEAPMPEEQEQDMMPDEQMEDEYLDFIIDQSLSPEEETSLMSKLEADPELSVMFDKVMDTATEFAGAGPVDGPGSGVSDSIPARLSDGEFVFTAKATEQIGADRLQSMMDDAEAEADVMRQQNAEGGKIEEEPKVDRFGKPVDEDIAEDEIRKGMMSVNPRLQ